MAVFRRPNSKKWVAQVYVGRDETGRKQYREESHRTERDAKAAEARLRESVSTGRLRPSSARTLDDLLDRWLETAELSPSTRYGYEKLLAQYVRPELGSVVLRRLTPDRLDRFFHERRTQPGVKGKPLASHTVRNIYAVLRHAFNVGKRLGWLSSNPLDLVIPPRAHRTEVKAPPVEAVVDFLKNLCDLDADLHAVAYVLALTGIRRGEFCALRWRDIDFKDQVLMISASAVDPGGKLTVKSTKTGAARRVDLDTTACDLLQAMRDRAERQLRVCDPHPVPSLRVRADAFIYSDELHGERPVRPNVLGNRFRRVARKLGFPYSPHTLRHFSATQMIAGGVDVRTAATRLGHADPQVTLRTYSHAVRDAEKQAVAHLSGLLKPAVNAENLLLATRPARRLRRKPHPTNRGQVR